MNDNMNISKEIINASPGVPATEAQKEIWISSQMSSDASCAYNQSFTIELYGNVNVSDIKETIYQVVSAHDALSVRFSSDGIYMVPQKTDTGGNVEIVDINGLSGDEQKSRFDSLLSKELSTPFDLLNGPLWRAKIIICSKAETKVLFTSHHIVCDGWSLNVLSRQFGECYSAISGGTVYVNEKNSSFLSYAAEQNSYLKTTKAQEDRKYWIEQLSGETALPVLELPLDNQRPQRRTYAASIEKIDIQNDLFEKIKKHAVNNGISWYSFMMAAFSLLMHKLSGNQEVITGVPVAGQRFSNNPGIVGHCVSMLPVRVRIDKKEKFESFCIRLQDQLFDSYEHYNVSFGSLVSLLNIQRDPGRIPLVSVGFNYYKIQSSSELGFRDVNAIQNINGRLFETFEIYASVVEYPDQLKVEWQYNTSLFSSETIRRWLREYERLLLNSVEDPSCTVGCISVLTPEEKYDVLTRWNLTERNYPENDTVVEMFRKTARQFPLKTAVECCGRGITYKELDEKTDLLAGYLHKNMTGSQNIVCVCIERSIDMVVAILSVLKSGAAFVPIDPSFPDERVSYIVNDSGAIVLLTQKSLYERLKNNNIRVLLIDNNDRSEIESPDLPESVKPDSLAYMIYTSGTTGKPKGVEICHRSLSNFLYSMKEKPGIDPEDKLLSVTTISFDIAELEIWLPLITGATVCIVESDILADGQALIEKISSTHPAIMQATPSTWTLLLDSGWKNGEGMTILCGGEAMSRTLADRLLATGAVIWNMYGPTETTIWSSLWRVEPGLSAPSIGFPVANTKFYILDDEMRPVPIGVNGELYIAGSGLARGYHNRQELTNEKFIKNPFLGSENSANELLMYKTGDIARRLSDGSVSISGRSDFQVKIRGFRIELGEIETTLLQNPAIRECVVCDRTDVRGIKILVAYIVFHDNSSAKVNDISGLLRKKLPHYMIPSKYVILDSIPRLANNKVDRSALPESGQNRGEQFQNFVAPENEIEKRIMSIWSEVLGRSNFGVLDNFFDLGGHSMLLSIVNHCILDHFKCKLSIVTLFEHTTIRSIAEFLQKESVTPEIQTSVEERANRQKAALSMQRKIRI